MSILLKSKTVGIKKGPHQSEGPKTCGFKKNQPKSLSADCP